MDVLSSFDAAQRLWRTTQCAHNMQTPFMVDISVANNWPGGGEAPLSKPEKWIIGLAAVVLIAGGLTYLGLIVATTIGVNLARVGLGGLTFMMLVLAAAWVQPWTQEPPRPRMRRR